MEGQEPTEPEEPEPLAPVTAEESLAAVPEGQQAADATDTDTADTEVTDVGPHAAVAGLLFWVAVGIVVALLNDSTRTWIFENWWWFWPIVAVAVVLTIVVLLAVWAKKRSAPARAAVYLLVVLPLVALGTAGIFWLPTAGQLITLRGVVLGVLVVTPALMWWLFIATQRASLLNEFITNLDRLGLLAPDQAVRADETEAARETRISSYLQKFEAAYGALPPHICEEVLSGEFRRYSSAEARDRTSLTVGTVPVTLTLVTMLVGWILVLPPVDTFPLDEVTNPRWLLALTPNTTPVTFAFLGAYFFSMQMLFRRYVRGDLRGSAYMAVVLRVVLAVVGIWVLQGVGEATGWTNDSQLLVMAFVIGVFPVVVWQVITGIATRIFSGPLPSLQSRLPLSLLDGLTVWHETRLEEEDIENVQNMATADIVDLLVNTRIPAPRLIDWIDQAILLTQLGPDEARDDDGRARRHLARHGVRTASALLSTAAASELAATAPSLGHAEDPDSNEPPIPSLIAAIRTNDNLVPIVRWRGLEPLLAG